MDFNPPDPDQVFKVLARLKDAFAAAADNSKGPAKSQFTKLSISFNAVVDGVTSLQDKPSFASMASLAMAVRNFRDAQTAIDNLAKTDPAVAKTLTELRDTIQQESQSLLGGLDIGGMLGDGGGLPGLPGGFDFGKPKSDEQKKPDDKKKKPKGPFDF
jgi:hypothetical protein